VIPGVVSRFESGLGLSVPHMGWNGLLMQKPTKLAQAIDANELVSGGRKKEKKKRFHTLCRGS
jgi:imidazoleglycerol phosphate synthase glutamine amidotransferase subunit HisH